MIAILAYIITMMLAARAIEIVGGDWARIGQVAIVLGMTLAALVLLPSARLRAWLRVTLAKHLFEHRYDYRQEWLRFTDTVGKAGRGKAPPLEERVVKALADIGGAPGGPAAARRRARPAVAGGRVELARARCRPAADGAEALLRLHRAGRLSSSISPRSADGCAGRARRRIAVPAWLAGHGRRLGRRPAHP